MRLSAAQRKALEQVAAGRVEWGSEHPNRDRRLGDTVLPVFLIDGAGVYRQEHTTYSRLTERGLIRERTEDMPMVDRPAETKTYSDMTGSKDVNLPARKVPEPGWRVRVELTDEGKAALGYKETTDVAEIERLTRPRPWKPETPA